MIGKFKKKIVSYKTPFLYTGSSIVKTLASIVGSFFIAKYVEPADFGLWSTISLALTYSVFLQGGIINGLNLELPYSYGKGNRHEAEKMAAIVQTYIIIISICVFVIGILFSLIHPFKDEKIKWGFFAITFLICLTFYQSYLLSTFRSNNSFLKLSYIQFAEAILNILTLILIFYYTYYGLLLKTAIVLLIYVILLHIHRPIKIKQNIFYWNKSIFFQLIKVGIPIFGLIIIDTYSTSIDKIWLIKYSDLEQIGLYSFGFYALITMTLFSSSLASYIYPRMTYNYGLNSNKLFLWKYVKKITLVVFIVLLPIASIGYFILPILIERFFPNYTLSIQVMQILLFAGLFKGCLIGVNVLWSIKKWKYMVIYQISYTLLLIGLTYVCFRANGNTIEGIAMGVLYANIASFINGLLLVYLATNNNSKNNYNEISHN